MRQRLVMVVLSLLLGAGGVAACAAGDDAESSGDGGGSAAPVAGDAEAATGAGAGGEAGPASQQGEPVEDRRRIIYTADLRLRVDDPSAEARRAVEIAEAADGQLDSQNEDAGDRVQVTVRVPSEDFREVLDDLAELGRVLERTVDAEDITEQVVDLESRLANAEASVERLRSLYADAEDVNQVVAIESALTERESEVESLTGQLRLLEDRADLSTVSVVFVREAEPEVDDDIPGFAEGFRTGWVAFRNVAAVGVTVAGFALPFLVVAVPLALVGRSLLRRRRRRAPERTTGTVPPATKPPAPPTPTAEAPERTG
jgi:hypothetical protein